MAGLLKRPAPQRGTGEEGVSLLTAMMIALTVFAIGAIWTSLATHQYGQSARERQRDQARNAAEAGINEAMSRLSADGGYSTSALAALPGGAGEYEVQRDPAHLRSQRRPALHRVHRLRPHEGHRSAGDPPRRAAGGPDLDQRLPLRPLHRSRRRRREPTT